MSRLPAAGSARCRAAAPFASGEIGREHGLPMSGI